ncbi:response regulator [uncultured Lacinutrix sp.]|uniref:ATP-binding response regulator n=1 Tax=uncultured Lacinutrix sp. TaxID=574032 RepID=UPI00262C6073|nr:response regulator [uncultured Lacinutrix sp.]
MFFNKKTFLLLFVVLQSALFINHVHSQESSRFGDTPKKQITKKYIDSILKVVRKEFYSKNYAKTISNGEEVIKLANKIDYHKGVYKVSSIMGNAFLQTSDTISAKKIFSRELLASKKRNDSTSYLGASIDLGNVYFVQKDYENSLKSFKQAMPYAKKLKDTSKLFILNYNISELYLNKGEVENAEKHVNEIGKYISSLKAKPYQAGYQQISGRFLYLKNKPEEAIPHLKKSIEISKSINYTDGLVEAYTYYAKAEASLGNYKSAFNLQQEVDFYKEEKYNTDKIAAIESETAKFKLNQYEQELRETALQNEFIEEKASRSKKIVLWLIVGSAVLLFILGLLLMSYRNRKKLLLDLEEKNKEYLIAKHESEAYAIAKSNFFSNISHELRTPLYGIIGISSILMDDKAIVEKHKEDVKSLKFSADYLLSLINDVLQISKLDAKQENSLNKITFNLEDVISGIMKSFEFLKVQNMNTFQINISKDVPSVIIGDDVKLSQILINLIGNACKFTENGTIDLDVKLIAVENKSVKLNFKIKDTGIGIPKNKQLAIFDEFTQVENDGGEYQGTGLGLPIVKKLLELHHSKIKLISDEGEGTEISFDVTYEIPEENYATTKPIELKPKISINNKTILVVDDNRINRIVTRKMLEKYKAKPLVAEGGEKAVDIVREQEVDLVLMDINMPRMNGLEATDAIRAFNTSIPIIALTAVEIEEMRDSIKNSTICDIIIKPYDEMVFVETILKHI